MGLFAKFKEAWLKPMSFDSLNEGFYDDLEEALILADVGMDTAVDAVAQLKKRAYAFWRKSCQWAIPRWTSPPGPAWPSSSESTAWVRPRPSASWPTG